MAPEFVPSSQACDGLLAFSSRGVRCVPQVSWAQQLYLVGAAVGENSTCLGQAAAQHHEVRFPQCGAEQDGLGGAREVTVTRDLTGIFPKC